MKRYEFLGLMIMPFLAGCGTSEHGEEITAESFARFECERESSADDAARQINGFASQYHAAADTHEITAGEPGKVVVVQHGSREPGGVQLIFVYHDNRAIVEVFGTKVEKPSREDQAFVSSVMDRAPLKDCKPKPEKSVRTAI